MALFPLFIDLKEQNVLVVGGGNVASRKIKGLLPFRANIVVASDRFSEFITRLSENGVVALIKRKFKFSDLDGKDMVIAAVDDDKLQKAIYEKCRAMNIAANCVDNPSYCSFIFPSLIVKGDLVIGISTSAKAPAVSKEIRKIVAKVIPRDVDKTIDEIAILRRTISKGKVRQNMIKRVVVEKLSGIQQR